MSIRALLRALPVIIFAFVSLSGKEKDRPDVLFIAIDDMNDAISLLSAVNAIEAPHLERLAAMGMTFSRAYCASPACNPSRVATLTGLRPTTSGVYGNKSDWRGALPARKTIFQQFREAGYRVSGAGKIFHHHLEGAFHDEDSFEAFTPMRDQLYPAKKLNAAAGYGSRNTDWGIWPEREEDSIDHRTVEACLEEMEEQSNSRPLFLACGIFKPHSPFFAPAAYHDDGNFSPQRRAYDWGDLPWGAWELMKNKRWFWNGMMKLEESKPGSYQDFLNAYAACCRYADASVGRILDGWEKSGRLENSIIVLWSDHGFHLGEKNHFEKFALWEKSNRIPFLIVAPGVTKPGSVCDRPVDLTALYPTLLDLAGLPADPACDGVSLRPLLEDPKADWDRPALMTYQRGNHAVRTDRWRYISYADGTEELYDHENDPHEWTNLARDPRWRELMDEHRRWLPDMEAAPVGDLRKPRE